MIKTPIYALKTTEEKHHSQIAYIRVPIKIWISHSINATRLAVKTQCNTEKQRLRKIPFLFPISMCQI